MSNDIVRDIVLSAPIDHVWAALTDPKSMRGWLGNDKKLKVDLTVAGSYTLFGGETTGTFTKIDEPHLLEYTWRQSTWSADWPDSIVRWELEPEGSGTQVHLTHSKFPNSDERDSHDEGWDVYFLEPLEDYLDGGIE